MAQITQLVTPDGKPAAVATKATGWFIHDGQPVGSFPDYQWGEAFSEPTSGNDVEFFWTGAAYFDAVRKAIGQAKKKIFVTGWQVNFDVILSSKDGKTLFQHLREAMARNKELEVYVMPWMSPKVGLDTFDFDTLLAMAQLNAGDQVETKKVKAAPQRAFTLLAVEQTDIPGSLAVGFSHHQKLVVIDEEIAFVGGIDLAYGRRDDGAFHLAAKGRTGSELYNPCIPPMHSINAMESRNYVTRWELFAGCFSGVISWGAEFAFSAPAKPIAFASDVVSDVSDYAGERVAKARNVLDGYTFTPKFVTDLREKVKDAALKGAQTAYEDANKRSRGGLDEAGDSASAYASEVATATARWLHGGVLTDLPQEIEQAVTKKIRLYTLAWQTKLQASANALDETYENLLKLPRMYPAGGRTISEAQPRMPWHDVQVLIRGPSVCDLSKNFIDRWNGLVHRYEAMKVHQTGDLEINESLERAGQRAVLPIYKRLAPAKKRASLAEPSDKKSWVQVLRSAPRRLLSDEAAAKKIPTPVLAQNNCLKAMLTAIEGSKYFIYIEGQFFQSNYGAEPRVESSNGLSPMEAMTDITQSPRWKEYEEKLNLKGARQEEILKKLKYTQLPEMLADKSFMKDLEFALANATAISASTILGRPQKEILNPIGRALVKRIERAIADGMPFHVYMVLPVHPEGTLDTLNIMTQIHYTMQSLVYGEDSLVNGIRRAILAQELLFEKSATSMADALRKVKDIDIKKLIMRVGDKWCRYLTLLNLRNWDLLTDPITGDRRPVTEQIYVHSKLLIADDIVAIIGSANINDRSQLGTRDSELAVIVRDDSAVSVAIDGKSPVPVSAKIHNFRCHLWRKIFGLTDNAPRPAASLSDIIAKPGSESAWVAIQAVALRNALAYQAAFSYLPKVTGGASSIWATWDSAAGRFRHYMPFHEYFWREKTELDKRIPEFTWSAHSRSVEREPVGVQGFIVALPITWTSNENNDSNINRTILADSGFDRGGDIELHQAAQETRTA